MSPCVVIRADGSPQIGAGHLMRCMAVAQILKQRGWRCVVAARSGSRNVVPEATAQAMEWLDLDESDGGVSIGRRLGGTANLLIVDHYGLDAGFESACRPWAQRIAVFDDLADRAHDCDVLIDVTLWRYSGDYTGLVPPHAQILAGSAWAAVRPEFARARSGALARRSGQIDRVLMLFGATDPVNATSRLLKALMQTGFDGHVDVVLGPSAPHQADVKALVAARPRTVLHVGLGAQDMAALMVAADLVLGAPGGTAWEWTCLGLPALCVVTAENQLVVAEALAYAGAAKILPLNHVDGPLLGAALGELAGKQAIEMSARAAEICDGLGLMRLVGWLDPELDRQNRPVTLRPAIAADSDMLLAWQCLPGIRAFARNPNPPDPQEHKTWYARKLADPDCQFTIIECGTQPAGMVRLDRLEAGKDVFEISILVDPAFQGTGIGKAAIVQAGRLVPWATIHATVLSGNHRSRAAFVAAGYEPVGDDLLIFSPEAEF